MNVCYAFSIRTGELVTDIAWHIRTSRLFLSYENTSINVASSLMNYAVANAAAVPRAHYILRKPMYSN